MLRQPPPELPVVITTTEEPPKTESEVTPDEPPPTEPTPDVPVVAPVVAAADPASVAFAVPIPGAVAVASAASVPTAPPREIRAAPAKPTVFVQGSEAGAYTPDPKYPDTAARRQNQGTVTLDIKVDASGAVASAEIQKSSGFTTLDEAAREVVLHRWHFPPGRTQWLIWQCTFRLNQ